MVPVVSLPVSPDSIPSVTGLALGASGQDVRILFHSWMFCPLQLLPIPSLQPYFVCLSYYAPVTSPSHFFSNITLLPSSGPVQSRTSLFLNCFWLIPIDPSGITIEKLPWLPSSSQTLPPGAIACTIVVTIIINYVITRWTPAFLANSMLHEFFLTPSSLYPHT